MAFHFRHCVAVMAASGFLCVDCALADDDVDEVVVTGSNIRGLPRSTSRVPFFSYSAQDMERSGLGSLAEYIQTIPQNFIGDLSEAATTGVGFGTGLEGAVAENQFDGFSAFSLRGLGSDATLTLLNGRRLPNAGMTETPTVSFIPTMLIERIDIVPDGASATYGADAVGGVVNLVTRRHIDGVELRARASTATEVTRNEYQFSAGAGHSWSGGNVYGVAAWQDRQPLVGDPVQLGNSAYQIAVTPKEAVRSVFGGASQQLGAVKLSLESSWFDSDRRSFQLTLPSNDRRFLSDSNGYSVYSTLQWQAAATTSFDLMIDYHENETYNETRRRGTLQTGRNHANRLVSAEARGQTELFQLPGGTAQSAAGVQYRRETLRTDATPFFQYGGGEVEVSSVFAEAFFPLIGAGQHVPWVRALGVSVAARNEDFGDPIGSKLAPKLGIRWSVTEEWSVRSTFSRSFLVPKLRDRIGIAEQVSFFAQPDGFANPGEHDPRLPAGTSLVMFRAGSNPALTPQDAKTFTAGFDFSPQAISGLDISIGYYRTRLTDRVATPHPDDVLIESALQAFANRNPTAEQLAAVVEQSGSETSLCRRDSICLGWRSGDLRFAGHGSRRTAGIRAGHRGLPLAELCNGAHRGARSREQLPSHAARW